MQKASSGRWRSADEQGREHRIVVVPAPSLTCQVGVFHRLVCIDIASNGVHSHLAHALHEGSHVVVIEARIEASDAIDVAMERTVTNLAGIAKLGLELIAAAKLVDGSNGCQHLHGGGRTEELALAVGIEHGVGVKVVDHHSHLRRAEHICL